MEVLKDKRESRVYERGKIQYDRNKPFSGYAKVLGDWSKPAPKSTDSDGKGCGCSNTGCCNSDRV